MPSRRLGMGLVIGTWLGTVWMGMAPPPGIAEVTAPPARLTAQGDGGSPAVRLGYTYLQRGLVNQAIAQFQRVVNQTPTNREAWIGLATSLRRAGRTDDAIRAYDRVIQLDPGNLLALKALGLLGSYGSQYWPKGIQSLDSYLKLQPNDVDARYQRALLLSYSGRHRDSLADLNQLLTTGNRTKPILATAAQVNSYAGNAAEAISLFEEVLKLDSRILDSKATLDYARALQQAGQQEKALTQLRQLRERLPKDSEVLLAYAQALQGANREAEAEQILRPLAQDPRSTLLRARVLNSLKRAEEAAPLYLKALADQPSPALQREVADVLSGVPTQRAKALQLYQDLAKATPNAPELNLRILQLQVQTGALSGTALQQQVAALAQQLGSGGQSTPSSQQQLGDLLAGLPAAPTLIPYYREALNSKAAPPLLSLRLAEALIQSKQLQDAQTVLSAYQPGSSPDLATRLYRADLERRTGNLDQSARFYQEILKGTPQNADALKALAGIQQEQEQFAAAAVTLQKLQALGGNDPQTRIQLGEALLAARQYDQAVQVLQPLSTQPGVALPLARALSGSQQGAAAVPYYLQALNATPAPDPELIQEAADVISGVPGQEQQALALYRRLAQRQPDDPTLAIRILTLENSTGQLSSADLAKRLTAQFNPATVKPSDQQQLAGILAGLPADPTLIPFYRALLEAGAEEPVLSLRLAEALLKDGDSAAARQQLEAYSAKNPKDPSPLFILADLEERAQNLPASLAAYQKILAQDPENADALQALAGLQQKSGDGAAAVQTYRQLLNVKPNDARIQINLAETLLATQQPQAAVELLQPLVTTYAAAELPLARAYAQLNQPTAAIPLYLKALQRQDPAPPELVQEAADVVGGVPGQEAVALSLYRQLAQADPTNPAYRLQELALQSRQGSIPPTSLQAEVLRLLDSTPPTDKDKLKTLAGILAKIPADPALLPYYQQVVAVGEPLIWLRIGEAQLASQNMAAAQQALRTYVQVRPNDVGAAFTLADLERKAGNLEASAQLYERILTVRPLDGKAYSGALESLAGVRLDQKKPALAAQVYARALQADPQNMGYRLAYIRTAYQARLVNEARVVQELQYWLGSGNRTDPQQVSQFQTLLGALPNRAEFAPLYQALLAYAPQYTPLVLKYAQALASRDPNSAKQFLLSYTQRNPTDVTTALAVAQVAIQAKDTDQALSIYNQILQLDPGNRQTLIAWAKVELQRNNFAQSELIMQQILASQSPDAETYNALIDLAVAQGNRVQALELLTQAEQVVGSAALGDRPYRLRQELLRQQGFAPSWERF